MPDFSYRTLRDRLAAATEAARRSYRSARRVFDDAQQEAWQAVEQMGLPAREQPVIDVGERPAALKRLVQGATGALILGLLATGALTLLLFFLQLLTAYLLAVSVLGLRLDIRPQAA